MQLSHRLLVERLTAPNPQPSKVLPGQKRKPALRDPKRGEKASREGPAPSYWVSGAFPAAPSNNKHTRAQAQLKWTLPSLQEFCPRSGRRFGHLLRLLVKAAPCALRRGSCHVQSSQKKKSPRWSSRQPPKVPEVASALLNMSRECGAAGETTDP